MLFLNTSNVQQKAHREPGEILHGQLFSCMNICEIVCVCMWQCLHAALSSGCARHFSNQCDIYKVVKEVAQNWSITVPAWSDTWPSIPLPELY